MILPRTVRKVKPVTITNGSVGYTRILSSVYPRNFRCGTIVYRDSNAITKDRGKKEITKIEKTFLFIFFLFLFFLFFSFFFYFSNQSCDTLDYILSKERSFVCIEYPILNLIALCHSVRFSIYLFTFCFSFPFVLFSLFFFFLEP